MFSPVPTDPKRRKKWLILARRDPDSIVSKTFVFMCEDHFHTYPPPGQDGGLEPAMQAVVDFLRLRLLNFAVAGLLTLAYLLYQYWELLFCTKPAEDMAEQELAPRSRSRSREYRREDEYESKRHHRRHGRRHESPEYERRRYHS